MARALAKPMKRLWPHVADDFDSAALVALVEAAQSFDASRQVKFSTFARHRILGGLRDIQRRLRLRGWRVDRNRSKGPKLVSLSSRSELNGRVLTCDLEDPPVGSELEAIDEVERWLRKLPRRHASVCREIYLHGHSQLEAAQRLGFSQSRLSCVHREAIAMLNGSWYERPFSVRGQEAEGPAESSHGELDDLSAA
jgi:RNA polymerase sigma factor (sigma-70 family)